MADPQVPPDRLRKLFGVAGNKGPVVHPSTDPNTGQVIPPATAEDKPVPIPAPVVPEEVSTAPSAAPVHQGQERGLPEPTPEVSPRSRSERPVRSRPDGSGNPSEAGPPSSVPTESGSPPVPTPEALPRLSFLLARVNTELSRQPLTAEQLGADTGLQELVDAVHDLLATYRSKAPAPVIVEANRFPSPVTGAGTRPKSKPSSSP